MSNVELIVEDFINYLKEYHEEVFPLINEEMEDIYEDEYQDLLEMRGDWFCKYCDTQDEVNEALDLFDEKFNI